MAVKEHWWGHDVHSLVNVVPLLEPLDSEGDGDLIGVVVTDRGLPIAMEGDIYGYVTGSDGETHRIEGTVTDTNKASFSMTEEAYVTGQVNIVIKLEAGESKSTIGAFTGFVK